MRGFFYRISNTIQYFMQGRYGIDRLGIFLIITGFAMTFLAGIRPLGILAFPSLAVIIFAYVRIFSKNHEKRRRELMKYERAAGKARERFSLMKRIFAERKTHKHLRCKTCKTRLRVPRGKGKIEITCPKCRTKIIKRT